MEFTEFLSKQNGIYEKNRTIDANLASTEGIKKGFKDQGGYLIILRHPLEVTEPIENFARRIESEVPCIAYGSHNLHTTISDYGIKPLNEFEPNTDILLKLRQTVSGPIRGLSHSLNTPKDLLTLSTEHVKFNYPVENWLYNQTAVMLGGMPSEGFVKIAGAVVDNGKRQGLELRMPWGAHITVARFTDTRTPENLINFFNLMKEAPQIPNSIPTAIDVGYFKMSEKEFNLTIYDRFKIQR